ncbi:nitroimidazol reductase NimA-like FMN-containing flavoprotein (pyridoxamine 5'-phosphate oxidase superfamily) [Prauserella shujinwangii]|uniref:Nitroimidazol reductase NimA-like FMN-containing flavoprotein (Pyridoxamine 5'-phosphate oxidase superfamily) n=1 Tax=Prauserella shujinwangii TaxID=1453103 RepID=A0A2T0LWL6_9PSEU|nr:pyridoxamine 5'-phosphate oxidase family protein [Prauserella shujinwangii]PRX48359.1 nitroimidazol reductase NimA-like FMN-containing flavoprotein (pyridoxamine 5'-phosphate oxidase superfamily) [Prauserella shujinwangii]
MLPSIDIEELAEADCLELLRAEPVGRLVFTERALPAIRPVNFVLDGHDVVVRSAPGSWADRLGGSIVAFEVDRIDPATHTGWSVVVLGKVATVTDVDTLVRLSDPRHRPWAPGRHDRYLRIRPGTITGRRLALGRN